MTHTKLIERWHKSGRHEALRDLLNNPVVQDALAIITEEAQPKPRILAAVAAGKNAEDAAFQLSVATALQAGLRSAVDRLNYLATVPESKDTAPEFYAHITEDYFDHA